MCVFKVITVLIPSHSTAAKAGVGGGGGGGGHRRMAAVATVDNEEFAAEARKGVSGKAAAAEAVEAK